jgi:hypothetical protein
MTEEAIQSVNILALSRSIASVYFHCESPLNKSKPPGDGGLIENL